MTSTQKGEKNTKATGPDGETRCCTVWTVKKSKCSKCAAVWRQSICRREIRRLRGCTHGPEFVFYLSGRHNCTGGSEPSKRFYGPQPLEVLVCCHASTAAKTTGVSVPTGYERPDRRQHSDFSFKSTMKSSFGS